VQQVGQQTEQDLSACQERRDLKGVIIRWLPKDFHTFMCVVATISCLVYDYVQATQPRSLPFIQLLDMLESKPEGI